jgi:hypothetical protein
VKNLKKANPAAKKSSTAYAKSVGLTLKKNVFAVLKARKAPVKARVPPKSPAKRLAKAPIKEVVVSGVEGFTGQPLIPPNRPTKKIKKLPKYLKKL